ncbi:cholecystokinin receptor [Plakobranchus ocellatus]|uniref:Cholecystokinin receptor n=1 Tax=Plakobranchus ocellatus TaxID=259542 RepID=A0AAV4D883_9GAST|nr:cholecystokinin receptor [Plakobranchus ocellatus]
MKLESFLALQSIQSTEEGALPHTGQDSYEDSSIGHFVSSTGHSILSTHHEMVNDSRASPLLLQEMNLAMFVQLSPVVAYLVLLMVAGLVGNIAVCYIFGFKLGASTQNFLLLSIGVCDLMSCMVSIPAEIVDLRHHVQFKTKALCKTMRFFTTFPTLASIQVLLVIAADRYRKICRPLYDQIELHHARLAVAGIAVIAFVFSVPAIYIYGLRTFPTPVPGLMGQECSVDDSYQDRAYPIVYVIILVVAFVMSSSSLIIIYFKVWLETKRHKKYMKAHTMPAEPTSTSEEEDSCGDGDASAKRNENGGINRRGDIETPYRSDGTLSALRKEEDRFVKNVEEGHSQHHSSLPPSNSPPSLEARPCQSSEGGGRETRDALETNISHSIDSCVPYQNSNLESEKKTILRAYSTGDLASNELPNRYFTSSCVHRHVYTQSLVNEFESGCNGEKINESLEANNMNNTAGKARSLAARRFSLPVSTNGHSKGKTRQLRTSNRNFVTGHSDNSCIQTEPSLNVNILEIASVSYLQSKKDAELSATVPVSKDSTIHKQSAPHQEFDAFYRESQCLEVYNDGEAVGFRPGNISDSLHQIENKLVDIVIDNSFLQSESSENYGSSDVDGSVSSQLSAPMLRMKKYDNKLSTSVPKNRLAQTLRPNSNTQAKSNSLFLWASLNNLHKSRPSSTQSGNSEPSNRRKRSQSHIPTALHKFTYSQSDSMINSRQRKASGHSQHFYPLNKKKSKSSQSLAVQRMKKVFRATRMTVIAVTITSAFILSYLPHLSLSVVGSFYIGFEHNLDGVSLVLYNIFLRSYFVNSAVNVFVYGSMNREFRDEAKKIWGKIKGLCVRWFRCLRA